MGLGIFREMSAKQIRLSQLQPSDTHAVNIPIEIQQSAQLSPGYQVIKRVLDIVITTLALLVLLPVFLAVALAIRFTSRGPIMYYSKRVGLNGEIFLFPKFRSMYVDADKHVEVLQLTNEKDGPIFKIKQDPRITRVGRFIRKYSLDELPQLFCVLSGKMTLVGPRPPIIKEVQQYDRYCLRRLAVKPGITCYWQIMGRSDLSFQEWMELDHKYIDEMSLKTDLYIMWRTPKEVICGRGAY